MISVRFQVFFIDPSAERPRMLCAVSPMFTTPSAVETLVQTARFEKRIPVVFSGNEQSLTALIKLVERLDIDDWLDFEPQAIVGALKTEAEKLGATYFDLYANQRNQDPILAKAKPLLYPNDLPPKAKSIWDGLKLKYAKYLRNFSSPDEKMAALRLIYSNAMTSQGKVPWTSQSSKVGQDKQKDVADSIMRGFDKWEDLLKVFERHLKSSGDLKSSKPAKFSSTGLDEATGKYELKHVISWSLSETGWAEIRRYLLTTQAFKPNGPGLLQLPIDKNTRIEVFSDSPVTAKVFVIHFLTSDDAKALTGEETTQKIESKLKKLMLAWYEKGKLKP